LARLSPHLDRLYIRAGQGLFLENKPAGQTFLIEKGAIEIMDTKGNKKRTEAGYVGMASAIGLSCYNETGMALENTWVIAFPQQHLRRLLGQQPEVYRHFLQLYAARFETDTLSVYHARSPRDTGEYAYLQNELKAEGLSQAYDNSAIIRFNLAMVVARLGAIFASMWFWERYLYI